MALIVEDGTGMLTANSYISVADFQARNLLRGAALTGDNGSPEQVLLAAMDYIESQLFIGYKYTQEQALLWPRGDVVIDGYNLPVTAIPKELINALCETALAVDAGNSPLNDLGRETKREKVGDIEIEYMDDAKSEATKRVINSHLQKLVLRSSASGNGSVELMRA